MSVIASTVQPEQRVVLHGVSWEQYEALLTALGDDQPALRLSYLEGSLEIMTTSREHEKIKTIIGLLLEAYFFEKQIRFIGIGAATFRKKLAERGLEPDECYCIGEEKEFPDLAIEVVISSGSIDKLEIYRGLGVREVWWWRNGSFNIHVLQADRYESRSASELLPDLSLDLLARHVQPDNQYESVLAFRKSIIQK